MHQRGITLLPEVEAKKEAREDEKVFRVWKLMLTTAVDTFTEKRHGSLFKKLRGITNDS